MKINYPYKLNNTINGKTNEHKKTTQSRGMLLENSLNITNEFYLLKEKANIHKKPTPFQVVKVNYPDRTKAKIVEAYYKIPSTTDYNGIYNGKYIDFEAKETINKSFYFKNIYEHQVKHLLSIDKLGGIAFVIIYFKKYNEIYIIDIKDFNKYYSNPEVKAITIELAREIGTICNQGFTPPIDYLKAIDTKYFKK